MILTMKLLNLTKIISHNKEHELKYNNNKLIDDGYPQNKYLYLIK